MDGRIDTDKRLRRFPFQRRRTRSRYSLQLQERPPTPSAQYRRMPISTGAISAHVDLRRSAHPAVVGAWPRQPRSADSAGVARASRRDLERAARNPTCSPPSGAEERCLKLVFGTRASGARMEEKPLYPVPNVVRRHSACGRVRRDRNVPGRGHSCMKPHPPGTVMEPTTRS